MSPRSSLLAILFFSVFIARLAPAENKWNTPFDIFLTYPGADVTISDDGNVRKFYLPGEIYIREDAWGIVNIQDRSGLGAVLCARNRYRIFLIHLKKCGDSSGKNLIQRLDKAVEKIDDFIYKNAFEQDNRDPFWTQSSGVISELQELYSSNPDSPRFCIASEVVVGGWIDLFAKYEESELESNVDKLLSIPRLPVAAPCDRL